MFITKIDYKFTVPMGYWGWLSTLMPVGSMVFNLAIQNVSLFSLESLLLSVRYSMGVI